jgi:cold shock CspA family protein
MREFWTVVLYKEDKGFAFLKPDYPCAPTANGTGDVFLHVRSVMKGKERLRRGARVEFELITVGDGRFKASNAVVTWEEN